MSNYITQPGLAARYATTTQSIRRWRKRGKIPREDLILPNGIPAWKTSTIEKHERSLVARRRAVTNEAPAPEMSSAA